MPISHSAIPHVFYKENHAFLQLVFIELVDARHFGVKEVKLKVKDWQFGTVTLTS